jgi:DNA/RNA-binding domain of Phe-tRNA-synthetase-like protein
MPLHIRVAPHPLLELAAFTTELPAPLSEVPSRPELITLLAPAPAAPMQSDDGVRAAVRDLLRHGGYKPTGRGKPASEYLIRAAADGALASINVAVDACNAVSLHSGLPISVVDLDLVSEPLRIAIAPGGTSYAFNASGQVIDVGGLLCLSDAEGPCANGVKDAQRSKTHAGTRRTVSILWGARGLGDRVARALTWYRELLGAHGASTEPVALDLDAEP